jgi:flavin reductase (DIM6/NTAB) family NADH-FMN oxidoreductase RutF
MRREIEYRVLPTAVECRCAMDPKTRQKALRLLTNGVYVMTSRSGEKFGAATVTWVSQAGFKPPLLMVALRKDGNVLECATESRQAVLHILDKRQANIAQKFFVSANESSGLLNGEPYAQGKKTSAPVLANLHAYLECEVREIMQEHGDHAIAILEVVNAEVPKDITPLTVADSPWEYGG